MVPAAQPEDESDQDRQREVHEIEEHRDHVLRAYGFDVIEGMLQRQGGQGSREDGLLETRQVVWREAGLRGESPHRLVGEEKEHERSPVRDEGQSASHRDRDHEQRQHHPLGLNRDATPEHHADDHGRSQRGDDGPRVSG